MAPKYLLLCKLYRSLLYHEKSLNNIDIIGIFQKEDSPHKNIPHVF